MKHFLMSPPLLILHVLQHPSNVIKSKTSSKSIYLPPLLLLLVMVVALMTSMNAILLSVEAWIWALLAPTAGALT